MARYLVSDIPDLDAGEAGTLWHHIFERGGGEVPVRFVYDTEIRELVVGLGQGGFGISGSGQAGAWWTELSPEAGADLQQSIEDNIDLADSGLHAMVDLGVIETDDLPDWALTRDTAPSPKP